jgi:nucleotide-binding universal stress UspA family protein
LSLAQQFGAHATATAIVFDMTPPPSMIGDYPVELLAISTEDAEKRVKAAYENFAGAAALAGVPTQLRVIEGLPGRAREDFGKLTRHFDISVIEQPSEPDNTGDELQVESAIFRSGRPVLIVPCRHQGPAKLDKILVAWDGGLAAARAVGDAMPLLTRAGKVEVVTIASRRVDENALPGFDITQHLARHGVQAELKRLPDADEPAQTLLAYAKDAAADLIVMGGYGHSRLREFILGGATRSMLASMTLPVLMSH